MQTTKLTIAFVMVMSVSANIALGCTTVMAGKGATKDGSVMIGKNDDWDSYGMAMMLKHPARAEGYQYHHDAFSYNLTGPLLGYKTTPIWGHTGDTHSSPPADDAVTGEKAGINDAGVAVLATETLYNNPNALAIDPYISGGIGEYDIPTVLLTKAHTAREAVILLGSIIEQYGVSAGEGYGVAIADKNEAWYLETASGHRWVAARVPDDSYFVAANQSRLGQINLGDSKNFLGSHDLLTFAQTYGLYNPATEPFLFYNAYGTTKVSYYEDPTVDLRYNYPRVGAMINLYSSSFVSKHGLDPANVPVFLKPDKLLAVSDIENGTSVTVDQDPYIVEDPSVATRPVGVYKTTMSDILQLRSNMPKEIANILWVNQGMTTLGLFVPFYYGSPIPAEYDAWSTIDQYTYDDPLSNHAPWRFRRLAMLGLLDYPQYGLPVIQKIYRCMSVENPDCSMIYNFPAEMKKFEQAYMQSSNKIELLNEFTNTLNKNVFRIVDSTTQRVAKQEGVDITSETEVSADHDYVAQKYKF